MNRALIAPGARVAVVGAGPAGLAAARALRDARYRATMFERGDEVGGQWNSGSPTSVMYDSLRCNLANQCMQFRDVPFVNTGARSFLSHREVQEYLVDYSRRFKLRPHIRFGTTVERIAPSGPTWRVSVNEVGGAREEHAFDAVCIANGHFMRANTYIPPGALAFCASGRSVRHSRTYRVPDPYVGRRVVVVGASSSGTDIALELERAGAAAVYLSHNHGASRPPFAGTIPQLPTIASLSADGSVTFADGTTIDDVDDVLLCTGYRYDFPFLDPDSGVHVEPDGRVVQGLVAHCIGFKKPTLSVIGVPGDIAPFPMFEDQATFVVGVLSGAISRQTLHELYMDEREEYETLGQDRKYFHKLMQRQWEYRRFITSHANIPEPSPALIEIYSDSQEARLRDARNFRERKYKMFGDGTGEWRVFLNGEDVTGKEDHESCISEEH